MMAIAIQNINESWKLVRQANEYVLSVPGQSLAQQTLDCGYYSSKEVDKVKRFGIELISSDKISVPGLKRAIANIELTKEKSIETGDHTLVIGRVVKFGVNSACKELPLLSVGPNTRGYRVLAQKGIHRIAMVGTETGSIG